MADRSVGGGDLDRTMVVTVIVVRVMLRSSHCVEARLPARP
jgi:hypothetical protein